MIPIRSITAATLILATLGSAPAAHAICYSLDCFQRQFQLNQMQQQLDDIQSQQQYDWARRQERHNGYRPQQPYPTQPPLDSDDHDE
jgi:hypothetical protein